MRKFIEFADTTKKKVARETPRLTLQKRGNFSLNEAAFERLGRPPAVVLLYDADSHAIGLKPSTKEARNAYTLRKHGERAAYVIAGVAFCKQFNIDHSKAQTFEPVFENGVLVVELHQQTKDSSKRRGGLAVV